MRKLFVLIGLVIAQESFATVYHLDMACGEAVKARNGKILRRLEPGLFGINAKYVLTTVFEDAEIINESGTSRSDALVSSEVKYGKVRAKTKFSIKDKFLHYKKLLKKKIEDSGSVYACVGRIEVGTGTVRGAYVFTGDNLEDVKRKFRRKAYRHL